jgi:hypothetical protein
MALNKTWCCNLQCCLFSPVIRYSYDFMF